VAEAYPELKANQSFLSLQQTLAGTEDAISGSRQAYNQVVRDLNTRIETVPSNIIANMFNFKRRDFFEIQDAAERAVPQVRF
jgi:LemA protein